MKVETGCLLSLKKLREREQLKCTCVQRSGSFLLFWRHRGDDGERWTLSPLEAKCRERRPPANFTARTGERVSGAEDILPEKCTYRNHVSGFYEASGTRTRARSILR